MMIIDRKRKFLPPVYNAARVLERPIPLIEPLNNDDESSSGSSNADESTAQTTAYDQEESTQSQAFEQIQISHETKPIITEEDRAAFDDLFGDGHPIEGSSVNDDCASNESTESLIEASISGSVLRESFMRSIQAESTRINVPNNAAISDANVENVSAHTNVGASSDGVTNNDGTHAVVTQNNDIATPSGDDVLPTKEQQIEANLREVLLRGTVTVIDDDLEFISLPNQQLAAIASEPTYQIKANDLLSGNVPFKSYVSFFKCFLFLATNFNSFFIFFLQANGDRRYMIEGENGFEEVWLKERAVTGLLKMNKKKPEQAFDLIFLKALLIGLCSIQKIKSEQKQIVEGIMELAQEIFAWRVKEKRMETFEKLFKTAVSEIRNNNFK